MFYFFLSEKKLFNYYLNVERREFNNTLPQIFPEVRVFNIIDLITTPDPQKHSVNRLPCHGHLEEPNTRECASRLHGS